MEVVASTLDPDASPGSSGAEPLEVRWLGRVGYRDAWALQHDLVERRVAGEIPDQLLLLEHPAVLTLGRHADETHVRASASALAARGIELIRVERGGEVTYHGPGQLVAYPILALSRRGLLLRPLVRALEAAMVETCAAFGVAADRRDGHPGCWCDPLSATPRKIGALGIRVERGVTYHGIALNVDPAMADFDLIDPCGMPDVISTSIACELAASAEGVLGDARRGITSADVRSTFSGAHFPARSDAPEGISGVGRFAVPPGSSGAASAADPLVAVDAPRGIAGPPSARPGEPPIPPTSGKPSDAPRGIESDRVGAPLTFGQAPGEHDAPTGISGGTPDGRPTAAAADAIHATAATPTAATPAAATPAAATPTISTAPTVEAAAWVFARALADHLGAVIVHRVA